MLENYSLYIELVGVILVLVGWIWLLVRAFRQHVLWGLASLFLLPALLFVLAHRRKGMPPFSLVLLGMAVAAGPAVYTLLVPVDLGPRETIVDGERHLTLTGWDRKDYNFLGSKHDTTLLQMANPDVTDETLERVVKWMISLRELDLNDTQVTDAGLKVLKDLPALESLRLRGTRVTDAGFRESLAGKESLMRLDLTGTKVGRETVEAWRKARPGRRALL